VRLAARIAGNARNTPPTIGEKRIESDPATAEVTAPKMKRTSRSRDLRSRTFSTCVPMLSSGGSRQLGSGIVS
jgi:hypothetical protein